MGSAADRNLLFGVLALQMDFVSREQLIAAVSGWVLEKNVPLGDLLVRQGAIGGERRALLEALVNEHLKQHGGDPEQSLATISSIESVRDELQRLADPQIEASLLHVARDRNGHDRNGHDPCVTQSVGESTSAGLRFRVLRPHAKGGLGEVFVAEDGELRREVALKQIQPHHADDANSRSRFVLEAEITGGLEHPGIVPVYGLGTYADGRPFYAMRFIRGDSLKDAIERFHSPDAAKLGPGERALQFRKLLGRFIDVCNAIDYAHSRGVLHRDLKPGNIMLGKYGETLVVDWGLAKAVGRAEPRQDSAERVLQPSSANGSAPTQMGAALGTPQYMSPEQAAGRLDQLGPPSDVYSLGATLYCLLTGKSPYSDKSVSDIGELLRRVERGDLHPPRQLAAEIPKSLEAICLKAMSVKPADRYPTPRGLADDIEHWLADEPISARPDNFTQRLARWTRRHRAWAQAAVIALVLVAVVASSAAVLVNQQRKLADDQRLRAETFSYAADVRLAQQAATDGNLGRALHLLRQHVPRPGDVDLRGFEWRLLWRLFQGDSLATFHGHTDRANSVAYSPDGTKLATSGNDGRINLIDVAGQKVLGTIEAGLGVNRIEFSPDGRLLAVALGNWEKSELPGQAVIYDVATLAKRDVFAGHTKTVNVATFSPDGKLLATASEDDSVLVWKLPHDPSATPLKLTGHRIGVNAVKFSPDGKLLAAGSGDGHLQVWNVETLWSTPTPKPLSDEVAHVSGIMSLAFAPTGQIVLGTRDGLVLDCDPSTGHVASTFDSKQGIVQSLACSRDGKTLVTAGSDCTIKVWDLATKRELAMFTGHTDIVYGVAVSPTTGQIASASRDRTIKFWDPARKSKVPTLRQDATVPSLAFSPDGKTLLTACGVPAQSAPRTPASPRFWDLATGTQSDSLASQDGMVTAVAFAPDGKKLASGNQDSTARLFDANSRQQLALLSGHTDAITSVAFAPDSQMLATASRDTTVKLWKLSEANGNSPASAVLSGTLRGHDGWVQSVAFSPDGRTVATCGFDKTARLWDVASQQQIALLPDNAPCTSLAFSPDGRTLAVGSKDRTVRLWNLADHRFAPEDATVLQAYRSSILCVAFSPDGKTLAGGGQDATVTLWNLASLQEVAVLREHEGGVLSIGFSPDGNVLATGSSDQTVRLWRAAGWNEIDTNASPAPLGTWTQP